MITGRGLHDLRIDEADIVHSAANSIMMAAADLLGRQVGTRLGFDAMGATGGECAARWRRSQSLSMDMSSPSTLP